MTGVVSEAEKWQGVVGLVILPPRVRLVRSG